MGSLEISRSKEIYPRGLDALIVPGKNIGVMSTPETIRHEKPLYLSVESVLNVIAAVILHKKGVAKKIIFTSGYTAGKDIPSEAQAMKDLFVDLYPEVPDNIVILEEKSKDTSGNAEEVSKIVSSNNFNRVGIVDVGFHLKNARTLFRRYGIKIGNKDSFGAEEVVFAEVKDKKTLIAAYNESKTVKREKQKELIRRILLATVDRKGKLLRIIAKLARK